MLDEKTDPNDLPEDENTNLDDLLAKEDEDDNYDEEYGEMRLAQMICMGIKYSEDFEEDDET